MTSVSLFGQLSPNTVTASAGNNPSQPPDQAVFSVTVTAGLNKGLADVVNAAAPLGLTAANLAGVSLAPFSSIGWIFSLPTPLSQLPQTTAALLTVQQAMMKSNTGLTLSFAVQNIQASSSPACDFAALLADARTQAQARAAAANSVAGAITGLAASTQGPCSLRATFAMGYQGNPGPHAMVINASRTLAAPPDQVALPLTLVTPLNSAPSDAAAALGQLGIGGAALSGVSTFFSTSGLNSVEQLAWTYTLTAPLANLNAVAAQLTAAQQALAKQNPGFALQFSIGTLQTSPQTIPACKTSDLVNDATALAANLAAAAGVTAGPIQAMSDGPAPTAIMPVAAARLGAFVPPPVIYDPGPGTTFASFLPPPQFTAPPAPATCSLAVQFQLQ